MSPSHDPTPPSATCRLLVDTAAVGPWNMAVDEAVLESAAAEGHCWWRFYQWAEPTLSLGYFQEAADRDEHAPSRGCPLVRRPSGGGAILHDAELTYSFAVPAGHRLAMPARELYETVHRTLVEALQNWGVNAVVLAKGASPAAGRQPFLCFQRRAAGDVALADYKIAGSAQRRRAGAILQHGSVLLGQSALAPELLGVAELSGRRIAASELADGWLARLGEVWGGRFVAQPLPPAVRDRAEALAAGKYGSDLWTLDRGRPRPGRSPGY